VPWLDLMGDSPFGRRDPHHYSSIETDMLEMMRDPGRVT
jgi:hypothetical protein